jgi:hypothetical protein
LHLIYLVSPHSFLGRSSPVITPEEFISAYKATLEEISSSPSGKHVGHYKAILKFPSLVYLHSTMMYIPFQIWFPPPHWSRVMDMMLEKEEKNSRYHRLCIIALFESDCNQAKRIIVSCHLTHHLEEHSLLPSMQHGSRPGQQCQGAVLKKILNHDIIYITKRTAAFLEIDAIGCYDRLVNNLILLIILQL